MDSFDVLIVGAGPAGSSCAWKLAHSGFRAAVIDKSAFPRDKICGGWITPAVFSELGIDPCEYARGRVLQPITGFRTGPIGGRQIETNYRKPVSYGIRRREFDQYLIERSGAALIQSTPIEALERSGGRWIVNRSFTAPMLIGAGGTFCPVARFLGAKVASETVVAAQEAEFEMSECQAVACAVRSETPELYFCPDMKGYGWCFRKGNVLNVGLGRLDRRQLSVHTAGFSTFLRAAGRLGFDLPPVAGHAYLLFGSAGRNIVGEGVLLAGDAAGVAYEQSGEGIRPAIESGLLAAKTVIAAQGVYTRERLGLYRDLLIERFGSNGHGWALQIAASIPGSVTGWLGRRLITTKWFTREVVLNRWFLRLDEPAFNQ